MIVEDKAAVQPDSAAGGQFLFPEGIPGFEKYTRFRVFHKEENGFCTYWLESLEKPSLSFTLVDPTAYDLHYELTLTDREQQLLQARGPEECGVFMMLTRKEQADGEASIGAHLAGPLVINLNSRLGLQKVLTRSTGRITLASA